MTTRSPMSSARTWRTARAAGTAVVVAALLIPAGAAHAADVVSQGTGRLVETSLLGTNVTDNALALRGARAINSDASGDVTVDQPLDASAIAGLIGVSAGSTRLFGDNGIIQLGTVGQYAQARDDGSSSAFAGAVSAAPSLIGVSTVTPSNVGSPTADQSATFRLGSSSAPVGLSIDIGGLAASAQQAADGTQTGQYVLSDADFAVDGTVVSGVLATINPALDTLISLANTSGAGLTNPFSSGRVELTLDDLTAAAGVASVNDLPAGTDLLSYVPQAVAKKITTQVDSVLDSASALADRLRSNVFTAAAGLALQTAVSAAQATISPVLTGISGTLVTPLSDAITQLAQMQVNVRSTGSDGSFTQTALRLGLGPSGSLASVDLANATVGPNAGRLAVPVAGPESLTLAVGLAGISAAALAGFALRRRARASAVGV